MADHTLGIIGAGNMAEAIVRGALRGGVLEGGQVLAAEPRAERREQLAGALGIATTDDNAAAGRCARVLLAVKPQVMDEALASIAGAVGDDATVISIAAGVSTARIDAALAGRGRIVRVMPNTPMLVGAGVCAMAPGARASDEDLAYVRALLGTGGTVVDVEEGMMDAVTAVSGSGPAYFFYFVEAMVAAGVAEGLPEGTASMLAGATCVGAGKLLIESGEAPATLRARVTSPGGTTQRAVESLDADGVAEALHRAVRAAAERSRQLGAS
jgi:pyrroline-5-carboxylate reductase